MDLEEIGLVRGANPLSVKTVLHWLSRRVAVSSFPVKTVVLEDIPWLRKRG